MVVKLLRLTSRLRGGTFLLLALSALLISSSVLAQGATRRAGLVVRFGDGHVMTRCVSFAEPSITGIDLLTRAGLPIVVDTRSSIGAGVCKIENEGCAQGKSCFCQCEGATCAYWQYFSLQDGAWKYSNLGAGVYQVNDGAVQGWAWGSNVAPPVMSLDQICAAGAAVAVPTAVPTVASSVTPTLVPTRAPTASSTPTATPLPLLPTSTVQVSPTALAQATVVLPAATAISASTPTPTIEPTLPSATSTATAVVPAPGNGTAAPLPATSHPATSSFASYAVFGAIVLGLGAWLLLQSRRKAR